MDFQVQIEDKTQLLEKLKSAPSIVGPILQRALLASQAVLAKHTVKGVVPWRTGFLATTFRAEIEPGQLKWFPSASYAPYVEFGTRPHVIKATNKRALYWKGADHPVAMVNHPGTKPNAFMERIVAASQPEIDKLFGESLGQATKALA